MKKKYTKPRNTNFRWVCKRRARKLRKRGEYVLYDYNFAQWCWVRYPSLIFNDLSELVKSKHITIPKSLTLVDMSELEDRTTIFFVSGVPDAIQMGPDERRFLVDFKTTETGRLKT